MKKKRKKGLERVQSLQYIPDRLLDSALLSQTQTKTSSYLHEDQLKSPRLVLSTSPKASILHPKTSITTNGTRFKGSKDSKFRDNSLIISEIYHDD